MATSPHTHQQPITPASQISVVNRLPSRPFTLEQNKINQTPKTLQTRPFFDQWTQPSVVPEVQTHQRKTDQDKMRQPKQGQQRLSHVFDLTTIDLFAGSNTSQPSPIPSLQRSEVVKRSEVEVKEEQREVDREPLQRMVATGAADARNNNNDAPPTDSFIDPTKWTKQTDNTGEEVDIQRQCEACATEEQEKLTSSSQSLVQRQGHEKLQASDDVERAIATTKGQGRSLEDDVRVPMEQAFGANFSSVRIHTDGQSDELNQAVQAKAFTTGQDIYFRSGAYQPGSRSGQELLAHELTHVVQQNQSETKLNKQFIQRVPSPPFASTFKPGLSPIEPIYKNTYDGSAFTKINNGWENWSFERRWQLYDADDNLLDESYYTIPKPTYKIDKKAVLVGKAGGTEKPWSIWIEVTKTMVPFGGSDKENFPHTYVTFPVFDTSLHHSAEKENESDKQDSVLGTALPKGKSPTNPANTKVAPDVAIKILENLSKGEPPFIPSRGKAGCSWFITEGNPYTGIDASKSINIAVEITKTADKVVFDTAKLNQIFGEVLRTTEGEAESTWRQRNNKVGKVLTPAQERQLGKFKERFAETKMWDRVGEIVHNSKHKVGEVIVERGRFSRTGAGKFAVVADPKMIQVKGGIPSLISTLDNAGLSAEPTVTEAAEALAKKQKYAGRVRAVFRYGGKILLVVAVIGEGFKIYYAKDKLKAVITSAGGWAGATAAGAAFAAWFTPADTAGPWAWVAHGVGTLVAGGVGYWIGSETTRYIYELVPAN